MISAFPMVHQRTIQHSLFQFFMDKGEQFFQHLVKCKELFPLEVIRAGDRLAPEHPGQLLGVTVGPGIGLGFIGSHLFGHQQGTDDGYCQQQHDQGHKGQNGIQHVSHLARPFLYSRNATPMAMAPEGSTIKLVEPVSDGTKIKSRAITSRGSTAIFMLPR